MIETCQIGRAGSVGPLLTRLGTGVSWPDRPDDLHRGLEQTLRCLATSAETVATGSGAQS